MNKENPTNLTVQQYMRLCETDYQTMITHMNVCYYQGFKDGQDAAGFDLEKAMERISLISGIGPGKLDQIKRALIAAGGKERGYGNEQGGNGT